MKKKRGIDRRIGDVLRGVLLWPVAGILAVLGKRFAMISNPGRIGHVASEVDSFLKERELGLIPEIRPILLINRKRAGNAALLDVYRQYMTVWDRPWQRRLLAELAKIEALRLPLGRPILGFGESARYQEINWLWGDRAPAVRLPPEIEAGGRARLSELGVPDDAWFVAVHAREGGYSPRDEKDHAHRNADIGTFGPAFSAIAEAGGWVIRMGDPSMKPLAPAERVIDYALSAHKADWMDLWLCAHTRFFIGTTSGLSMVATMFGRDCALANMIPHGAVYGMGPGDVSIPKRLFRDGAEMPLPQVFAEGLSHQRHAFVFADHGVTIRENTGVEIRALVEEMLGRHAGHFETTAEDADLQRRFRALLTPIDYCYGAVSRIGRDWLRENRHLLEG